MHGNENARLHPDLVNGIEEGVRLPSKCANRPNNEPQRIVNISLTVKIGTVRDYSHMVLSSGRPTNPGVR